MINQQEHDRLLRQLLNDLHCCQRELNKAGKSQEPDVYDLTVSDFFAEMKQGSWHKALNKLDDLCHINRVLLDRLHVSKLPNPLLILWRNALSEFLAELPSP